MKQLILTFSIFAILLTSCSIDVDLDETQGYIYANATGDNTNGNVSNNGYLDLDIVGEDDDGITYISIEIPALNIDVIIDNNSSNNRWEISQTFNANEDVIAGVYNIYITLKDNSGNEYSKTVLFTVD